MTTCGGKTQKKEVNPTKNSTIKTLENIKGINLQKAMEFFAGSEELYLSILKEFVSECKENLKDIKQGLDAQDIKQTITASHKLKGTASNIFVTQVCEQAKALELILRQTKLPLSEDSKIELYTLYETLKASAAEFITSVEKI
jgi:HPt (histidine-containing phosphotransfer) domain-containing protein